MDNVNFYSLKVIAVLALVIIALIPAKTDAQYLDKRQLSRLDYLEEYETRRDSVIDLWAGREAQSYLVVAAKLYRNRDIDWVLATLDTLLSRPQSGDMFWMYPFITVTYAGKGRLPEEYKKRMREKWKTYVPYRGDTENHWAMYYSALYLITQMYSGEPGHAWFNGKSSTENFEEARDYLIHWMDLTTTIGQGEYDSPDYFGEYIASMALLYAYAEDPAMKQRARMMLDYLFADFAIESLHGLYIGAHSRTYPRQVEEQWATASSGFAYILFGNIPYYPRSSILPFALSDYRLPEIIYCIATDRSVPYIHKELKRTRHRMRYSEIKNAPVYKYDYMTADYAVGSSQGGLLQPIQQHTWDVTWAVKDPRGKHNTLFTIHPYSSPVEGGMYFSEVPEMVTELIVRSKTTYDSPDKWTGGSPYEEVFQQDDAVIVLYNIPEGTRFSRISGYFSKDLRQQETDKSGWIFARGGEAYIAYYPLAKYQWIEEENNYRLHSNLLKNGAVAQLASTSEFESFGGFKKAIKALPLQSSTIPNPSVRFTNLRGTVMEFEYGNIPVADGTPIDYGSWKLFEGPFLNAEKGSNKLEISYGNRYRLLDFNTLTIKDWVETDH